MTERWDVVVVGAGPAGSAAALGALDADPSLSVLLLDRYDFPRDKACGDGVAPHVLDVLADVGVTGLLDDRQAVGRLSLSSGGTSVERVMRRPAYVVPREVLDARLVERACAAGAVVRRHRVRDVSVTGAEVHVDGVRARLAVGADGAYSIMRRVAGLAPVARRALAVRGYAPTPPGRGGKQVIVFGAGRQPAYAWSFDRGDGLANVGYGEVVPHGGRVPARPVLLDRLDELLPGAGSGGQRWRGHHLPLSSWPWPQPDGRVLLAGDAAGLINPMTGEGIFYAVATGVAAGRAAARCLAAGDGHGAGRVHRREVRSLLSRHLLHTDLAARLVSRPRVVGAGIAAAADDQRVFDDLVEVGLGRGLLTARTVAALTRRLR